MPPMTQELAEDILLRVGQQRKKKGSSWNWETVSITPHHEAVATCTFNVDTPTVQKWFRGAGANAYRIERLGNTKSWQVYFELARVVQKAN